MAFRRVSQPFTSRKNCGFQSINAFKDVNTIDNLMGKERTESVDAAQLFRLGTLLMS